MELERRKITNNFIVIGTRFDKNEITILRDEELTILSIENDCTNSILITDKM